jgi:hypothetical protein
MEDNQKYNKRRRSYTEFRSSYSDNKKYFISTDKQNKGMAFLKYFLITIALAFVVLVGFVVTDALLEISETPYSSEETTTESSKKDIDGKYFENQVTIPADKANNDNSEIDTLE